MKRKCSTPRCRRPARDQRTKCRTCEKRAWKLAHPIGYLFDNLRTHARTRGKTFTITIEQFTFFCEETGYHLQKGTDPESATIDRIRPELGYVPGNLRVLAHAKNSSRKDSPATAADLDEAVI